MTELYGGERSLKIALHILKEIKQIELAARLEQKWGTQRNSVGQRSQLDASPSDKPNGYAAAGSRQENSESRTKYMIGDQHFIDKHRVRLIDTISTVDPILDRLMSKNTITQENYREIRSKSTSTQKMRELFDLGSLSTLNGKDCLYDVLMELEPFVMEELKDAGVK
ncbi:apoptosis-associated speck-like protein containing a CARD [Clupea harengus]|uniref:Apoptosis-associated speck-like protein containing a CARD n=1 Tax=Clupea harengus TaxID=7950 RepID=A0A8M1KET5_CLUHA|nr:apoptosis-associated speck-like protein containing a CARD [Clupea harengus]